MYNTKYYFLVTHLLTPAFYNEYIRTREDKTMSKDKSNSADSRNDIYKAIELFGTAGENAGADFLAMTEALRALNGHQSAMFRRDNKGMLVSYTRDDHEKMVALYEDALRKNEQYLKNCNDEDKKQDVFKTAEYVQKLMLRDLAHIRKYDPAAGENFPSVLNGSRSVTVNTTGVQLEKWGGVQSSRIPMTITGRDGKQVSGVFTPVRRTGIVKPFKAMTDEICAKYPSVRPVFENLVDNFRQAAQAGTPFIAYGKPRMLNPRNTNDDYFLLLACCESDQEITPLATTRMFAQLTGCSLRELNADKDFREAIDLFVKKAEEFNVGESINTYDLKLDDGERVDNRNAAMSTVAALLGRPDLICPACEMTVVNNGEEISGTFMELAKGVDPAHPTQEAKSYDPEKDQSPEALRAIADLQVIDYICGNVDRHALNYFYQFENKDGKLHLTGLVGIDNDSSFSQSNDLYSSNFNRLIGTDNMRVVTKSMADKVKGLTAESLSFSLRAHGLNEKAVTAACKRLEHLQDCLRAGEAEFRKDENRRKIKADPAYTKHKFIRIVPDDKFADFTYRKLAGSPTLPRQERKDNLFNTVSHYSIERKKAPRENAAPAYVQSNSLFSADGMKKRLDNALVLLQKLKDGTNYRGTSEAFEKMRGSLDALSKVYAQNTKQLPDFDSVMAINKALVQLGKDAKAYITKKAQETKSQSSYALHRRELAEEVYALATTDAIDPEKLSDEEIGDLRNNAEQNTQNICRQALAELQELRMKENGMIRDAAPQAENAPLIGSNP